MLGPLMLLLMEKNGGFIAENILSKRLDVDVGGYQEQVHAVPWAERGELQDSVEGARCVGSVRGENIRMWCWCWYWFWGWKF